MKLDFDSIKPVYLQIAEAIEDDIIGGKLQEGDAAYSQLIIARELNVNPATAAKGINMLVTKGILDKQRGASMTVASGARQRLFMERREKSLNDLIEALVKEAIKLELSQQEVLTVIKQYYIKMEGNEDE